LTVKKIIIVTPAKAGTLHGNRATAERWAAHLTQRGYQVEIATAWQHGDQDLMIALHAVRSHAAIQAWKSHSPAKPLVLVMTGTDLYRDLPQGSLQAHLSLKLADCIVVLQGEALKVIAQEYRLRTRVIFQSIVPGHTLYRHARCFLVTVIGHLRPEKDPFRINEALQYIQPDSRIHVVHLGMAMDHDMSAQAQQYAKQDPRYVWLGERPHRDTMRWLASSHLMVISSVMEGGAHVVSEAIALGIPVIASDIDGNRGLLGADYPGLYKVGDGVALAALLERAESNPAYLESLKTAIQLRQPLITPERESAAICAMIEDLSAQSSYIGTDASQPDE